MVSGPLCWGLGIAPISVCLAARIWGLLLCQDEPAAAGGLGEAGRHVGQGLLQRGGVQAGAGDGLPGGLPVRAGQGVHALGGHLGLDAVLDGLDLCGQLVSHAAKLPEVLDLAL